MIPLSQKVRNRLAVFVFSLLMALAGVYFLQFHVNAQSLKPQASINVSSTVGSVQTDFVFDGSASLDSRGNARSTGMQYIWKFSDGTQPVTGRRVTHRFSEADDYIVSLEVIDSFGLRDETNLRIVVRDRNVLSLFIRVDPPQGTTNTVFTFNAITGSGIGTPDERLLTRFDFEGDGIFDTPFSTDHMVDHVYGVAGLYPVTAEVLDVDGASLTRVGIRSGIAASLDPNKIVRLPVYGGDQLSSAFSVFPAEGDKNTIFHIDASTSRTKVQGGLEYRYDFNNDGIFEIDWTRDPKAKTKYVYDGFHTIAVQVRNRDGLIDTTTQTILVVSREYYPPEPRMTVIGDPGGNVNQPVGTTATVFRMTISVTDADSNPNQVLTRIDFEGDGIFDTPYSTERIAYHQYRDPGRYVAVLQAQDIDNNVSELRVPILVNDLRGFLPPGAADFSGFGAEVALEHRPGVIAPVGQSPGVLDPTAVFNVEPKIGTFQTNFAFDASAMLQREGGGTSFAWDFEADPTDNYVEQSFFGQPVRKTYRYTTTGEKLIRLYMFDQKNGLRFGEGRIYVHWSSPYLETLIGQNTMPYSVKPNDLADRATLLASVMKLAGYVIPPGFRGTYYQDLSSLRADFRQYIEYAHSLGILSDQADRKFHPNRPVTRAEAVKILMLAYKQATPDVSRSSYPDVSAGEWPAKYVEPATAAGIVKGYEDGRFSPWGNITNGETAKIVVEASNKLPRPAL